LSGEIFSSKALIVGATGIVDAQIEASILVVQGSVKGNVRASERVELMSGARVEGDVHTPILVIQEGALFAGNCSMGSKSQSAARGKGEAEAKVVSKDSKAVSVPVVTSTGVVPTVSRETSVQPEKESNVAAVKEVRVH
jgi:cytoskeletal protein CcmA (bactofilin family)